MATKGERSGRNERDHAVGSSPLPPELAGNPAASARPSAATPWATPPITRLPSNTKRLLDVLRSGDPDDVVAAVTEHIDEHADFGNDR